MSPSAGEVESLSCIITATGSLGSGGLLSNIRLSRIWASLMALIRRKTVNYHLSGNLYLLIRSRPETIYKSIGYVFESRFSAGMIQPISIIFGILNKEWSNFKKMLFIFLQVWKRLRYRCIFKTAFLQKMSIISKPWDGFSLTSANRPQRSLVLYLQVWSQSWT